MKKKHLKKSRKLYITMMTVWLLLIACFIPAFLNEYRFSDSILINILLTLNGIFIMYFWLNGVKDVTYVLWYYCNKKNLTKYTERVSRIPERGGVRVTLVYCTCNDFNSEALEKCMHQTYPGCRYAILDDSQKESYIHEIDAFQLKHPEVEVIRRKEHNGFKAGNLNNYLLNRDDYDYFVILDSDEVIPDDYVSCTLKYFDYYDNIGIVQCSHRAINNINRFMDLFHIGVDSHWPTYQTVKNRSGFMSLLGHGAMVSKECYRAVGKVPHVVAEDLCFSIEARNKGYYVAFAPDIVCGEEYPVDYIAFKKRHNKWTQGNMEFIKSYTVKILRSNMLWFEKLDIFLFTYNLPLTAFFSLYIIMNVALLPALGYQLHYPAWLIIPTIIFFFAPMANDFITYIGKVPFIHLLSYMFNTFVLYGSMLFVSLKASLLGMFGKKAVFLVTPKDTQRITWKQAIIQNKEELVFAVVMTVISELFHQSFLPVALLVVPAILSVYLTRISNPKENRRIRLSLSSVGKGRI